MDVIWSFGCVFSLKKVVFEALLINIQVKMSDKQKYIYEAEYQRRDLGLSCISEVMRKHLKMEALNMNGYDKEESTE